MAAVLAHDVAKDWRSTLAVLVGIGGQRLFLQNIGVVSLKVLWLEGQTSYRKNQENPSIGSRNRPTMLTAPASIELPSETSNSLTIHLYKLSTNYDQREIASIPALVGEPWGVLE
jgi:hypothetical protein